jgi:hypothetical protein
LLKEELQRRICGKVLSTKTTPKHGEAPLKLGEAISWLMGALQRSLFPKLEECWRAPLTEKEQQLVKILEIVGVERYVPKTAANQGMGRKVLEREAIARSFVAIVNAIESGKVANILCVWHGQYRTDIFLMDKDDLVKRLKA